VTEFKLGDIVRLKSGGPEMRVNFIDEITCRALNTESYDMRGTYNANSLKKVEEDEFRFGVYVVRTFGTKRANTEWRRVLLHRVVLQPAPPSLSTGLSQPRGL
jgi:uncharacterized protein YodC (DUF2158 family)